MSRGGPFLLAASLLFGTVLRPDVPQEELDPDHGHAPGIVHADADDADHRHGDADDHHDAPNTPCHHHETHSCFGHGSVHLMADDASAMNLVCWQRFIEADVVASSHIRSKKQFHVPLA